MKKFLFHVAGLPHLAPSKSNNFCAYTMKIVNFCRMMKMLGHTVYLYGPLPLDGEPLADGMCDKYLPTLTQHERIGFMPATTDRVQWMLGLNADPNAPLWQVHNSRTATQIVEAGREPDREFICIPFGSCQQPLTKALPDCPYVVETGIGYGGTFADFRVFESYSHMHLVYGVQAGDNPDGKWYDAVIPNYFDPADFGYFGRSDDGPHEDYLLFVGRMIKRKGLEVIAAIGHETGRKVKLVGPGGTQTPEGVLTADGYTMTGDMEYLGVANVEQRRQLMQNAAALLAPTQYVEPFGGVAVEAQLCGTPVITVDWGAFTETVEHGVAGYRCRTLNQFVNAVRLVDKLDRAEIYRRAVTRWGLQRVMWQYQEYFEMLDGLRHPNGWSIMGEKTDLDWLRK